MGGFLLAGVIAYIEKYVVRPNWQNRLEAFVEFLG